MKGLQRNYVRYVRCVRLGVRACRKGQKSMGENTDELQARLWDGHRKIAAARNAGKPAELIEDAKRRWCELLAELNRALCTLGELEPTYHVDGQQFVTYGCADLMETKI